MLIPNYHLFRQDKARKLSHYERCVGTGQGMSREAHGDRSCFEVPGMRVLKPRLHCNEGMDPSPPIYPCTHIPVQFRRLNQLGKGWLSSAGSSWQPEEGWSQLGKNLSSSHHHPLRKLPTVSNHKFPGTPKKYPEAFFPFPLCESNNHFCLFPGEESWQRKHLL